MPARNQGANKTKYSLSLNKNNAGNLNRAFQNSGSAENNDQKENRPVKRPLQGTYHNTLNAAKKLKPLGETTLQGI